MKIYLNVVNLEIMKHLDTILFSNDKIISEWMSKTFTGELAEELSPQYEIQVQSSSELKKHFWKDVFTKEVEGIYWWTEQCEWLVPTLQETQEAVKLFKHLNKTHFSHTKLQFVFLTSYWWSPIVKQRIIQNLEWLNQEAKNINALSRKIEIVINDVWTLTLLKKWNYKNLIPIFWRLFWKTLKMPLVEANGWEDSIKLPGEMMKNKTKEELNLLKEKMIKNQKKMLSRTALHTKQYWDFAKQVEVERASLDYNERYPEMFENHTHPIDVYYPYWLIFVGRVCDTCWLKDVERSYYPLDKPCPRECMKYDLFIKNFNPQSYKTFQRGNAQYMSNINLDALWGLETSYLEHRLIYTPLI